MDDYLEESGADRVFDWNNGSIGIGEIVLIALTGHCGFNRLPKMAGMQWEAPELGPDLYGAIPPEWEEALYSDTARIWWVRATIERTSESELLVTALGTDHAIIYRPAETDFGCE